VCNCAQPLYITQHRTVLTIVLLSSNHCSSDDVQWSGGGSLKMTKCAIRSVQHSSRWNEQLWSPISNSLRLSTTFTPTFGAENQVPMLDDSRYVRNTLYHVKDGHVVTVISDDISVMTVCSTTNRKIAHRHVTHMTAVWSSGNKCIH